MSLSIQQKIVLEFGGREAGTQAALGIALNNLVQMVRRLPRTVEEGQTTEFAEICARLKAFSHAVDEPRLAELVDRLPQLAEDEANQSELERRFQALDVLLTEWSAAPTGTAAAKV